MIMCISLPMFMYLHYNIDLPYRNRGEKCNKKLMCSTLQYKTAHIDKSISN